MALSVDLVLPIAQALEASDTIVAVWEVWGDISGRLRLVGANEALSRAISDGKEGIIGMPLGAIVAPEANADLDEVATAVGDLRAWRGELLCVGPGGQRVRIGCSLQPCHPGGYPIQRFVMIGRDITRVRAEEQARKVVNHLLAKAFHAADIPLTIITQNCRIVMVNQELERQLGCMPGSLVGGVWTDTLTPPFRPALAAALEQQNLDGKPFKLDVALQAFTGTALAATLTCAAIDGMDQKRFTLVTARPRDGLPRPAADQPAASPEKRAGRDEYAGRLRFIDLDGVGGDTKHMSVAMDSAEQIIRQRLAPQDVLQRDDERGFTLLFANASEAEATSRATAIAREVRRSLISAGQDERHLTMQVAVAAVSPGDAAETDRRLTRVAEEGLRAARMPSAPPHVHNIYRTATGKPIGFHVLAGRRPPIPGSVILPSSSLAEDMAPLKWLAATEATSPPQLIFISASFEIFESRNRTGEFLGQCEKLAAAIRPQVNFILSEIPTGVTTSLVQDVVRRVKPFGGGVGCLLTEKLVEHVDLRNCSLAWGVIDLASWRGEQSPIPQRLTRWTGMLGAYGCKAMACNVVSLNALTALKNTGVLCATLKTPESAAAPAAAPSAGD
jgi:PAS domain-containing protein